MTASGFLIKTPEHTQPADALDEMLNLDGNLLLLAYGGVRYAKETEQDYAKLRNWLASSPDRHLTLIFGVWGNFIKVDNTHPGKTITRGQDQLGFVPFSKEIEQIAASLKSIFDFSKVPHTVVDRLHVYGIANFHPKIMFLSRKGQTTGVDECPVALQFGSSNFTSNARRAPNAFQYEMDLFLRWDNLEHRTLISQFVTQWKELHAVTTKYNVGDFNMDLFFGTFQEALIKNNETQFEEFFDSLSSEELQALEILIKSRRN